MNAGSQLGLEVEKARLGYGRVSIDDIEFACDLSGHLLRPVEPKNITRLERVFELEGVLRLLPEHYIAGIAPSHVNTQDLTQVRGAREPPWVRPADGRKIPCLYGRHRIEAAKAALPKRDQWWIVELFSSKITLCPTLHCGLTLCLQRKRRCQYNCT